MISHIDRCEVLGGVQVPWCMAERDAPAPNNYERKVNFGYTPYWLVITNTPHKSDMAGQIRDMIVTQTLDFEQAQFVGTVAQYPLNMDKEPDYKYAGDIVRNKARSAWKAYAERVILPRTLEKNEAFCMNTGKCYPALVVSDMKVGMGPEGASTEPLHKLWSELVDVFVEKEKIYTLEELKGMVKQTDWLASYITLRLENISGGLSNIVARLQVGNALLFQTGPKVTGDVDKDDVEMYIGQSSASWVMPRRQMTDYNFIKAYLDHVLTTHKPRYEGQDDALAEVLGSPLGMFHDELVILLQDKEFMSKLGYEDMTEEEMKVAVPETWFYDPNQFRKNPETAGLLKKEDILLQHALGMSVDLLYQLSAQHYSGVAKANMLDLHQQISPKNGKNGNGSS